MGAALHCRSCGYVVDGLPAGPCPECGVAFDPADPETVCDQWPVRRWWERHWALRWGPAAWPMVCAAWLNLALGVGWLVLGRSPTGQPLKAVPIVQAMLVPGCVLLIGVPISGLVLLWQVLTARDAAVRYREAGAWPRAAGMVALWVVGVVALVLGPAGVFR